MPSHPKTSRPTQTASKRQPTKPSELAAGCVRRDERADLVNFLEAEICER
jgi:hypothetical protein